MCVQEHRICHSDSKSPISYSRVLHFPDGWRLITHTADYKGSSGAGFLVSPIAFKSLDKVEYKSDRVMLILKELPRLIWFVLMPSLMSLTQLLKTYFTSAAPDNRSLTQDSLSLCIG